MKLRLPLLVLLLFISAVSSAQNKTQDSVSIDASEFVTVEVPASVDPGEWRAHLQKELFQVVEYASKKLKKGKDVINVRFMVEKDGSISDCKALNDPGYGIGNRVAMVVKSGPTWKPGMQNGKNVRSYLIQPITFVISE